MAGIDSPVASGALAGVAVAGGSLPTSSGGNTADATAVQVILYAGLQSGMFFLDGQAAYLHVDQDVRRNMMLWGTTARSNGGLNGGGTQVNAGVHLAYGEWQVEPTLGLTALGLSGGGLTESSGGSLAERIGSQSVGSAQSLAAVRIGTVFAVTPTIPLRVHALVGWQHEFLDVTARTTASLPLAGVGLFAADVAPVGRDAVRLGAGFEVPVSSSISLYGDYRTALGRNSAAQYVTAGLRVTW